jgi:hypothetical protein
VADYRVRCPTCGSTTPADVNFCLSCGSELDNELLILEEVGAPTRPPDPVVAAAAASGSGRTGRKRWFVVAAVVVLAVILVAQLTHKGRTALASRRMASPTTAVTNPLSPVGGNLPTSTTTTFVTGATHTVMFIAGTNVVERVDLDANATATYDLSGDGQAVTEGIPVGVAVVGDRVVFQQRGGTASLPVSLNGSPAVLGHSVGFLPSRQPGRVWLISVPTAGPVAQEVDLSGQATSSPSALPPDWQPLAAVNGGLLLSSNLGFELWDPVANRVGFRSPSQASVVAAAGTQVAWQSNGCVNLCGLHLTNLTTGVTTVLYPQPPELTGGLQSGAFSPDGRYLAATSYGVAGSYLVIIDLQGTQQTVPAVGDGGGTPTWSPSGQWIFVGQASSGGIVYAYQRGATSAQTFRLPPLASGSLAVAAVASS